MKHSIYTTPGGQSFLASIFSMIEDRHSIILQLPEQGRGLYWPPLTKAISEKRKNDGFLEDISINSEFDLTREPLTILAGLLDIKDPMDEEDLVRSFGSDFEDLLITIDGYGRESAIQGWLKLIDNCRRVCNNMGFGNALYAISIKENSIHTAPKDMQSIGVNGLFDEFDQACFITPSIRNKAELSPVGVRLMRSIVGEIAGSNFHLAQNMARLSFRQIYSPQECLNGHLNSDVWDAFKVEQAIVAALTREILPLLNKSRFHYINLYSGHIDMEDYRDFAGNLKEHRELDIGQIYHSLKSGNILDSASKSELFNLKDCRNDICHNTTPSYESLTKAIQSLEEILDLSHQ